MQRGALQHPSAAGPVRTGRPPGAFFAVLPSSPMPASRESRPAFFGETGSFAPDHPLQRAREKHERTISWMVVVAGTLGMLTISYRIWTFRDPGGVALLACVGILAAYYGWTLWAPAFRPLRRRTLWLRSTLEVSVLALVVLVDYFSLDTDAALGSGATYLLMVAVVVPSMRLDAALCVYAASLALVQHAALYVVALASVGDGQAVPVSLFPAFYGFRLVAIGLIGVFGAKLASTLGREIVRATDEVRLRERVRAAFGSYVDARVVDHVLNGSLETGPQRRVITVLFVDIRGFTAIAEAEEPDRMFVRLTETLDAFAAEVQRQGGIVNKFLGDGLMALFGAPEEQDDHARRAVRAALNIEEEAHRRAHDGRFPFLRVGVGVHTGEAIVGEIGGARREYTAIGDVVNVAARVENANKELGTTVLITEEVRRAMGPGADLRRQPHVSLKGRSGTVELYEVRSLEGTAAANNPAARSRAASER